MNFKAGLHNTWSWVRQVSGDAAYENYLLATRRRTAQGVISGAHGSARPLSRAEFYLDSVRRRYSTVSRCC